MKTGLLDYTPESRDIQLEDVWEAKVGYPEEFGPNGSIEFAMLGNDTFGDCFWAAAAHETQVLAAQAGRAPSFTDESVLSSYCGYLGIQRAALNARTDRGTNPTAGARYRAKTGITDAHQWTNHYQQPGVPGHRIGAFVFDSDPNVDRLANAIHTFGAVEFCVSLPQSAEERFDTGVWDYVPGSPIAGGHAISGVGRKANGNLVLVSWGKEIEATPAFIENYLQTVIVYISGSALKDGHNIAGLDAAALRAALAEVTK